MDDVARYRAAIAAAFPDLPLRICRFLAEGWDSAVWEVNGTLVFRFPKRADVAARLRVEIALLPALAFTLPAPVPQFTYIADQPDAFPYPFVGYRKLPGVPLSALPVIHCASAQLAVGLGRFLTALHRFPTDEALACGVSGVTPEAWRAQHADMHAELRALVPRMALSERARMEALFSAYLDDPAHFQFTPVLLHRDLGGEHLLLDPQTGNLTAVIDWGDVSIGDPAQDFCGLPTAWLPALLTSYGGAVDTTFADRVAFYRALSPYHALVFGLRTGGERFIAQGLAALRT